MAVLPLAGAAGDPQTESLAAGVADSLITTLSKVPGLTVVSRAATLKYQDRKLEPDDIAGELGATMLVDGRVQRSGDRLRITLSLLEPGAKVVRWQSAYDGTFAEVFSLQREVADAVAGALRLKAAPRASAADAPPTTNVEAYAEYAQARSFLERPARARGRGSPPGRRMRLPASEPESSTPMRRRRILHVTEDARASDASAAERRHRRP